MKRIARGMRTGAPPLEVHHANRKKRAQNINQFLLKYRWL
jgi:hypothetical protein